MIRLLITRHKATRTKGLFALPRYAGTACGVMPVGLMRDRQGSPHLTALVASHITDTSRRSPSGDYAASLAGSAAICWSVYYLLGRQLATVGHPNAADHIQNCSATGWRAPMSSDRREFLGQVAAVYGRPRVGALTATAQRRCGHADAARQCPDGALRLKYPIFSAGMGVTAIPRTSNCCFERRRSRGRRDGAPCG
jgi:hypothetical protein